MITVHPRTGRKGSTVREATGANDGESIDRHNLERVRAIEAELTALGLTTHVTDGRAGLDLTATVTPSRQREPEFWIDEDGYAELRYYNPPNATPTEVAATARRVLETISDLIQKV